MTKAPTFTVPAPRHGSGKPPKKDPRMLPSDPLPPSAEAGAPAPSHRAARVEPGAEEKAKNKPDSKTAEISGVED